jgi:transposase
VLSFPPSVRIFVACGATDLRKSFDTLAALVTDVLAEDPFSGHVFCFRNRKRDRVKLLVWDRSGFWLFCKRLEAGTFADVRDDDEAKSVEVSSRELFLLLEGIEVRHVRQRKRYTRTERRRM